MKFSLQTVCVEGDIFVYLPGQDGFGRIQGYHSTNFLFAQEVQHLVGRDPVYPRKKLRVPPERGKRSPYFYEYFLNKVVSVLVTADKSAYMKVESFRVAFNYAGKGLFASAAIIKGYDLFFCHTL